MRAGLNWVFALLSGNFGWLFAVMTALICIGLFLAARRTWPTTSKGARRVLLIAGLAFSILLLFPYGLNVSRKIRTPPDGPFDVGRLTLRLPAASSDDTAQPVVVELWFPVASHEGRSRMTSDADAIGSCADLMSQSLAGNDMDGRRLVLYMPHFRGPRDDNSRRLARLASEGYIIAAFDDVALDPPPPHPDPLEEAARLHKWPYASQAQFDRSLMLNNIRVRLGAQKALTGLNRLASCARRAENSAWHDTIDYEHVGFLGYSLGGAVAAEAAVTDARIVAVVSLDGSLFGRAFTEPFHAPYLYVMRDVQMPTRSMMNSPEPEERYYWRFEARHMRREAQLAARPGSMGIVIHGTNHGSFCNTVFEPSPNGTWLLNDPNALFTTTNLYILSFLDARLRNHDIALIDRFHSPVSGVRTFRELDMVPNTAFRFPPPEDENGAPL